MRQFCKNFILVSVEATAWYAMILSRLLFWFTIFAIGINTWVIYVGMTR